MTDSDANEQSARPSAFRRKYNYDQVVHYEPDRFDVSGRMKRLNRLEVDFAQSLVSLVGPAASVLDAPCGSGRFYDIFKAAAQLTMLDFNETMIQTVREKHAPGDTARLVQGDVSALPFADGEFDLVFCMRLLHHVGDDAMRRKIIAELARVSRRYVALSVYSKCSFRYLKRVLLGKKPSGSSVNLKRFIAEADQAGLTLLRKHPAASFIEQQRMLLFEKRPVADTEAK